MAPGYVGLQEDVHLAVHVLRAPFYRQFAVIMNSVLELSHFLVSDLELLELLCLAQHCEDLPLVHDGLHQLVEGLHGVILDVEVTCRPP